MASFAVGDAVRYIGGGRFSGPQVFDNMFDLRVGQMGIVHAIPGAKGDFGCTFGKLKVSLNRADAEQGTHSKSGLATTHSSSAKPGKLHTIKSQNLDFPLRSGKGNASRAHNAAALTRAGSLTASKARTEGSLPVMVEARHEERPYDAEEALSESSELERPHPPSFYCPISRQCMHDPVVLTDGHTYERRYIERWLKHNDTSPVSGAKLPQKAVFPNHALRNGIEEYFEQIFLSHKNAIRQTTAGLFREQGKFSCNPRLLNTIDALMQCSILVNADLSVEMVLRRIMNEAKDLVGAEVASVFLVDRHRQELYSNINSTESEIRIPFTSGVAGRVACSGEPLIIPDAYEDPRFNNDVDLKTGFKTRNILCVPINSGKGIIGVAQLINKIAGGVLPSPRDQQQDFTVDDRLFFELLAAQAGSAVVSSGMFELMPSSPKSSRTTSKEEGEKAEEHEECQSYRERQTHSSTMSASLSRSTFDTRASFGDRVEELEERHSHPEKKHPKLHVASCRDRSFARKGAHVGLSAAQLSTAKPILKSAWEGWEIDVLTLSELTDDRPLSTLALYLLEQHGLISQFELDRVSLEHFLAEIEDGYPKSNQYHNRSHAASVLHFMHALLLHGGLAQAGSGAAGNIDQGRHDKFVTLACLLAAVVHDFEHNGLTNDFLVKSLSDKAITYNDRNVNEQHHVAAAFRVLLKPECNFLKAMANEDFRQLRSLMLDLVLATDMTENKTILDAFKDMTLAPAAADGKTEAGSNFAPSSASQALLTLKVALKCADLGHLALGWGSHMRWVRRLEEEFFCQGDKEKKYGMTNVSFLMDRFKPGVSQTQVGFFDFVVLPLFHSFGKAFPAVGPMVDAVDANYQRWCDVQADTDAVA